MKKPLQFIISLAAIGVAGFSLWQYIQVGNLGDRVEEDGVEVYYTDNVKVAEANGLLNYLTESGFADGSQKTLQLDRDGGKTWVVRAVVEEDGAEDLEPVFEAFARELSAGAFGGAPVVIHLCDENMKTQRALEAVAASSIVQEQVEMFYSVNVEKAEAEKLLYFMVGDGFSDGTPKTLSLDRPDGDKWVLRVVVIDGMDKDEPYARILAGYAATLSTEVFGGAPLEIHMADDMLATIRVVPATQD